MAFMMPITKKNYNIYGDRQRIASAPDGTDGVSRKTSQGSTISSNSSCRSKRRVRSEGPSLSCSPRNHSTSEIIKIPQGVMSSKPVLMRRARGSAPALTATPVPFFRQNSLPGGGKSVPSSNSPVPVSPSHSTGSSSSSSSESGHRFHFKLLTRLKKSLRIKDPAPAAS